jgi:hypothetical protein
VTLLTAVAGSDAKLSPRGSKLNRDSGPRIHIVLVDDWELRGDGSGNMRAIQFNTMRRLRKIYESQGLRASFNAEVMQQLAHIDHGRDNEELWELAREWEEIVRETYSRGHDVQLHVHPQWSDAVYENGRWRLRAPWSILDYSASEIHDMLSNSKRYLEDLLTPLNPEYRCVSFRSGSWCIAPSADVLSVLAELGVVFDMSIVAGLFYDTRHVRLDYKHVEEPFLPYYPVMSDARRIADTPQQIVCIPTHSFRSSHRSLARAIAKRVPRTRGLLARHLAPNDIAIAERGHAGDYAEHHWSDRGPQEVAAFDFLISDLAALTYRQMRRLLRDVRTRARAAEVGIVPIVLENHTKDIGNFEPLHRFARLLAKAPDVEVITPSQLAQNLRAGMYEIRTRNADA